MDKHTRLFVIGGSSGGHRAIKTILSKFRIRHVTDVTLVTPLLKKPYGKVQGH